MDADEDDEDDDDDDDEDDEEDEEMLVNVMYFFCILALLFSRGKNLGF